MKVTVSFDPLHFIGIAFCSFIACIAAALASAIILGVLTSRLDGGQLYMTLTFLHAVFGWTFLKLVVAATAAGVCMKNSPDSKTAFLRAITASAGCGVLCTFLVRFIA